MAKHDFSALLDREAGSAPQPTPVPEGTYEGSIAGLPKLVERQTKNGVKGVVQIAINLLSAGEDVDEGELAEAGGLLQENGNHRQVRVEFWLDDDSLWQLDNFLATFGFVAGGGTSYKSAFESLPDRSVTAHVALREYEAAGGTRRVNDVKRAYCNE